MNTRDLTPSEHMARHYFSVLASLIDLAEETDTEAEVAGAVVTTLVGLLANLSEAGSAKMIATLPNLVYAVRNAIASDEAKEKAAEAIQAAMRG
jgi:hypothetical protein